MTELMNERANQAFEVPNRRQQANQDVAFAIRLFFLFGLPKRRLPADVLSYCRQNGRFGLKGSLNEYELDLLRQRSDEARQEKARRGELLITAPVG